MEEEKKRILSIDALRGFDMMWIVGVGSFLLAAGRAAGGTWGNAVADQMEHVPWAGLHLMDLIFPTFVFLAGASWPFSLASQRRKGATDGQIAWKILKRFLILFALGLLYDNVFKFDFAHLRINSVLGRVGFGWAAAAATLLACKRIRTVVWWCIGIFAAYTLLSWLIPTLAGSANPWMPREAAAPHIIDEWLTPGRTVGKVLAYPMDALVAETKLSPTTILNQFRRETGKTPHQYLMACRIRKAVGLLSHTHRKVTDIALSLGFASSQHFAASFRREMGVTPRQWRTGMA